MTTTTPPFTTPQSASASMAETQNQTRIDRAEWRFVALIAAFVLIFTSLPYAYAYITTPADRHFMGVMLNVSDHAQYFSWYREFGTADLSSNKLTPEPNQPIFFNLMWWGLAKLGALLGVGYEVMYQVMRVIGTVGFMWVAYRMCAWFFKEALPRKLAFLTIIFSSGFGWLLVLLKYALRLADVPLPFTLYVAEPNTFYSILGFPHFVAAATYVLCFDLVLRGQAKNQLRYALYAGLWALFMGWQHAYDLVLVWGILGAYIVAIFLRDFPQRHRESRSILASLPWYLIKSLIVIGLISFSPALYSVVLTRLDPVWKEVLAQFGNAGVYTPPLYQLPILLGPAFLVALFTAGSMLVRRRLNWDNKWLFALSWFIISFPLVYLPVDFQIHMLNGWQVPIALLAVYGLFNYIVPALAKRRNLATTAPPSAVTQLSRTLAVIFFVAILPTNIYLWSWRFLDLNRHDYPFYLHKDDMTAMQWIEAQPDPNAVVLSAIDTGQFVPMLTGKPAYLAHWAQTLRFFEKQKNVAAFFDANTPDTQRIEILQQKDVRYVFYGPAERQLGAYNPAAASFLTLAFETPEVQVFVVRL